MRVLFGLLLFTLAVGLPCTKQRILDCFSTHVDTSGDGYISAGEWQNFVVYNECALFLPEVSPSGLISTCDRNGDSMLNEADYDAPNGCMVSDVLRSAICGWCDQCDAL